MMQLLTMTCPVRDLKSYHPVRLIFVTELVSFIEEPLFHPYILKITVFLPFVFPSGKIETQNIKRIAKGHNF